jgi:hypothetical protein
MATGDLSVDRKLTDKDSSREEAAQRMSYGYPSNIQAGLQLHDRRGGKLTEGLNIT